MLMEPIVISKEVALAIHSRQISEHGGLNGVRDVSLLESALARPQNLYKYSSESSIIQMAAAYAYGLINNHPFIDGNKRTAFVVCVLFLQLNGIRLSASQEEKYRVFYELAHGTLSEEKLGEWLVSNSTLI